VQDYVGSYLPSADGSFTFKEGPLLRAVKHGHWLLIDELDLAEPAVLSTLCPLLEGCSTLMVPGECCADCQQHLAPALVENAFPSSRCFWPSHLTLQMAW
jgi:hypothetical protein